MSPDNLDDRHSAFGKAALNPIFFLNGFNPSTTPDRAG
jgi:hypothetical protein